MEETSLIKNIQLRKTKKNKCTSPKHNAFTCDLRPEEITNLNRLEFIIKILMKVSISKFSLRRSVRSIYL